MLDQQQLYLLVLVQFPFILLELQYKTNTVLQTSPEYKCLHIHGMHISDNEISPTNKAGRGKNDRLCY